MNLPGLQQQYGRDYMTQALSNDVSILLLNPQGSLLDDLFRQSFHSC